MKGPRFRIHLIWTSAATQFVGIPAASSGGARAVAARLRFTSGAHPGTAGHSACSAGRIFGWKENSADCKVKNYGVAAAVMACLRS